MHARRDLLRLGVAAGYAGVAAPIRASPHIVSSPSARVTANVWLDAQRMLRLGVTFDGVLQVTAFNLGFDLTAGGRLAHNLRAVGAARSRVDDRYGLVCGKTSLVHARANMLVLDLREDASPVGPRLLQLVVRAYDDGVAFRYVLPPQPGLAGGRIRSELTAFDFPHDYECWGHDLGGFDTPHEGEYVPVRTSRISAASLFDAPLVCVTSRHQTVFALAEADLENYAALAFARRADGAPGVQVRLSPRPDDPTVAVVLPRDGALVSPWRVVMLGDHPGRLIESNLITTLSAPSRVKPTDWIRPGKAAWDWWSGIRVGPRRDSNATMTYLIDFAAASRLQYLLIDAGWYANPDLDGVFPAVDVTRSVPEIDLPMLVEYGRQRGIGLFVWINWRHLDAQLDEALAAYERLGLKGVKLDYMDRDDHDMIAFYHRVLARAAAHRIMVDLHGATHPTGLSRTYPNLMTQEGVMGAEHNKSSNRVTSRHNVTLAYTRMLLGPMDYTPGGFRNVTPAAFVARGKAPMVQTTRGQALAMYVVYDSPLSCVSDSPDAYADQVGFDFLEAVPTSWDETRVLSGEIGKFIVIARRKAEDWYVGAMTDMQSRSLSVPLGFLGKGVFSADTYADGAAPSLLHVTRDRVVTRRDVIALDLAANGGGAVVLRPGRTRAQQTAIPDALPSAPTKD